MKNLVNLVEMAGQNNSQNQTIRTETITNLGHLFVGHSGIWPINGRSVRKKVWSTLKNQLIY